MCLPVCLCVLIIVQCLTNVVAEAEAAAAAVVIIIYKWSPAAEAESASFFAFFLAFFHSFIHSFGAPFLFFFFIFCSTFLNVHCICYLLPSSLSPASSPPVIAHRSKVLIEIVNFFSFFSCLTAHFPQTLCPVLHDLPLSGSFLICASLLALSFALIGNYWDWAAVRQFRMYNV